MDFGLKDKTALVLGAGGGLGSAIAVKLAREGARIAAADIDLAAAEKSPHRVPSNRKGGVGKLIGLH